MATRYVAPTALGSGDGSSAANAAIITAINTQIGLAGPDGTVVCLAGLYDYPTITLTPFIISNGGTTGHPVTIKGDEAGGTIFRGARPEPWFVGGAAGDPCFRLDPGADNLIFEFFEWERWGLGCVANHPTTTTTNLIVRDSTAVNVQRFMEIAGDLTDSQITDIDVDYYSKGIIRLQGDSHDVLVENVTGDAHHVDGDPIPFGFCCVGTVHDVTFRNCHAHNNISSASPYWNGDGFVTEELEKRITFIDCSTHGNADGGWDIKGDSHRLVRCSVDDSKRNYRFWGKGVVMEDCEGTNPYKRGGTGTTTQVHLAIGAQVDIINSDFSGGGPEVNVFEADPGGAKLVVTNSTASHDPGATLALAGSGSTITIQEIAPCE